MSRLIEKCSKLKESSTLLSAASTSSKNSALQLVADGLKNNTEYILTENVKDVEAARENGIKESLIDRLKLNEERIDGIIESIYTIIKLKDPIWSSKDVWTTENGLTISKMTVPLGVIGIIYESRPNVTVDAFALALKSGNCILLRGSSSAINSNKALVKVIKDSLASSDISEDVIQLIEDTDRSIVKEMLTLNDYIDVIIPRGGADLIRMVVDNATVPTIETGIGNNHIYVDESANFEDAVKIIAYTWSLYLGICNNLYCICQF